MKSVLMVAEKPSLALSIAKILSNGNFSTKKGISPSCSTHEYSGQFHGEQVKFKMTSVCGHVMSLDFKGHFNNWDVVEPIELFSASTRKKEAMENLRIVQHLQSVGKGVDYLVLWLDCDKEGENICFEVIDCVKSLMNVPLSNKQAIFRAHFSAITDKDIKKAMSTLGTPNKNESLSVDARQELDLRVGCAFTRFQTRFFQGRYGDLDSSLISFGPCQTPTLAFCVDRHDVIQTFKPELFWKVQVILQWHRGRIFDKEIANLFFNLVKGCKSAKVLKVQEKEKQKPPPLALNTVELLRVASSGLSMGPQQTMHIAEKLYIMGYISYPRTETTSYPGNFDMIGPLKQQTSNPHWGNYVSRLLQGGVAKPRKGADAGDHPPITPMKPATQHDLSGDMWRLYDYVVRHFISTASHDCKYKLKTATFSINNEEFTCEGKTVISAGFTEIMDWQAIPPDETVPNFKVNEDVEVKEVKLAEKYTTPPDYLTESELITLMEKHGIGTDASISVHINNICQRNYVTVITSGRSLVPTPLGIVLVHGYHKIDAELALPTMRAAVERQLKLIASGEADYHAVLQYTVDMFQQKFDYFMKHIHGMDELFECTFTKLSESGKPLCRCGKCRRYMKYITAKPYRLHCPHCDETYGLPQDGYVKIYQELKCPLDDFELLLWTRGGKTKSFSICPYCYNHPPLDNMKENSGCNQCTHPTCKHSSVNLSVMECNACVDGVLVIEPFRAPNWQMSCNNCNSVWSMFKNALKVSVKDTVCECGVSILNVEFHKDKSPLNEGEVKHSGCPVCDPIFASNIKCLNNGGANIARGRGRGGRGRNNRGRGGSSRGANRGGKQGRGGRTRQTDDEEYSRPATRTNLSDFLKF